MSRKSRQRNAAKRLKHVAPPKIALFIMIAGLILGTLFVIPNRIVTEDEARAVRAVLQEVQGHYRSPHRGSLRKSLRSIKLLFEDHDPLFIGVAGSKEALLAELSSYPGGTVCDMLVQPGGTTVLSLHIGGQEIVSFEESVSLLARENITSPLLAIPLLLMGAYGAWSLYMCWQYRRVIDSHL